VWDVGFLVMGVLLAAFGGRVFLRGTVGLAAVLLVPPGIIGATVAAFATSSPEAAVGINAAINGTPAVAVGDALGGNVTTVSLVMGTALMVSAIALDRRDVRRDLPFVTAAPLLVGLLTFDGWLGRTDGAVLVTVFAVWLGTTVSQALRERDATGKVLGEQTPRRALMLTLVGIVALVLAGRLVVVGATGLGVTLGLDPFLVGATVVALGTSTPELATVVVGQLRGHPDLGAGTVMGSHIFNALLIVGGVALIRPFELHVDEVAIPVVAAVAGAMLLIPGRSWRLGRSRGALLLLAYGTYVFAAVRVLA